MITCWYDTTGMIVDICNVASKICGCILWPIQNFRTEIQYKPHTYIVYQIKAYLKATTLAENNSIFT